MVIFHCYVSLPEGMCIISDQKILWLVLSDVHSRWKIRPTARLVFLPAFAIATSLAKVQAAHPALLKIHINYGNIMGLSWE